MQTWDWHMRNNGLDSYNNYMGGMEHAHDYVLLSRSRDSDHFGNSNFETALDLLDGECALVYVAGFNHWAVGWIEHLMISSDEWIDEDWRSGAWMYNFYLDEAKEIERSIENYPLLDEEDYCRREWEEWEETYDLCVVGDCKIAIEAREEEDGTEIFVDKNGNVELTEEEESILFRIASDNACGYGYESWRVEEIVDQFFDELTE